MAMRLSELETIPGGNVGMTIGVVRSLITSAEVLRPYDHRSAQTALGRMRDRGETLRLRHASPAAKATPLARPADIAVDRAVGVVESRLSDFEILTGPDAVEAARVHALLFPEGLGFLRFKYKEEWTQVDALLTRIEKEELEPSLNTLVGAQFITHLRACQAAYGAALHVTTASTDAPSTLADPFAAVREALSTYVSVLVSAVKNEELPEADVIRALAPIAEAKQTLASAKKRAAAKGEDEEEDVDVGEELPKV